jgi:hypothetical protein
MSPLNDTVSDVSLEDDSSNMADAVTGCEP